MDTEAWVTVQGREYRIVDDLMPKAHAIAIGRAVDELSDAPPPMSVEVDWPYLWATTPGDGSFCIAGNVALAFSALDAMAYDVPIVVRAEGCRDVALTVHLPIAAALPVSIVMPALRREMRRVRGRVVERGGVGAPIPDARVFAVDAPGAPPGPGGEHALQLRTPLRFDHDVLTPVRVRALAPAGAAAYAVDVMAGPGEDTITLDNRTALAVGDLLRIGTEGAWEFAVIRALPPVPPNPADPGPVQLWGALVRGVSTSTPVRVVPRGAVGVASPLQRSATRGDGLLVIDRHLEDPTIEVLDANADHVEYAAVGALTDALGYYRADGVGRLRTCHFRASHAAFTTSPPMACSLDLARSETVLDFRLDP